MSRLEKFSMAVFLTICFAFLLAVLFMVGVISTNELRLNQ